LLRAACRAAKTVFHFTNAGFKSGEFFGVLVDGLLPEEKGKRSG
jgi:hypothetical protein